jgi:hypothetical protein
MRRKLRILLASGAVLLFVILCLLCLNELGFNSRDAEWYADYTARYGDLLAGIAGGEDGYKQSVSAAWILNRGGIETINSDQDRTLFFLKSSILEGYYALVYEPDGEYIPRSLGFYDNWRQCETMDGSLLWKGGMADSGYIRLYDLKNGFYLEEAYLPT